MLSRSDVLDRLSYNAEAGEFRWKKPGSNRAKVGAVAGGAKSGTYRKIGIDGVEYYVHRLVWLVETGKWPENTIDHINRNPRDNRFSNLREATESQQKMNQRRRSDNKSGVRGVTYCKNTKKWSVEIKADKVKHRIGRFACLAHAAKARRKAELVHHGRFNSLFGE